MFRRRDLLAYFIGAGLGGTLLVGPYLLRSTVSQLVGGNALTPPFFILPIAWGFWNVLWVRRQPALSIGAWGALLGVLLAAGMNVLAALHGDWFSAMLLLLIFVPGLYYLVWLFIVGSLNEALGVEHGAPHSTPP